MMAACCVSRRIARQNTEAVFGRLRYFGSMPRIMRSVSSYSSPCLARTSLERGRLPGCTISIIIGNLAVNGSRVLTAGGQMANLGRESAHPKSLGRSEVVGDGTP